MERCEIMGPNVIGRQRWCEVKREIKDRYFKQYAETPEIQFISGLPLPRSENGMVENVQFIGCDFHPCCKDFRFVNCDFIGCSGARDLGPISRGER